MPQKDFIQWLDDGFIIARRDVQKGRLVAFLVALMSEIDGKLVCVSRYDTRTASPIRTFLDARRD